jgi:hypothetical protein
MRKRKQKYKSVITQKIKHSVKKIGAILSVLFLVLSFNQLKGTNAYFTNDANVSGINFTTGWWIPSLEMTINKTTPDGKNDFYRSTPCVTLTANIHGNLSGIKIYYKFSKDGDPITNGNIYNGKCIKVPDGNPTYFEAQAVNEKNSDWKSNIVTGNWKVDTIAPVVKITNLEKNNKLSGIVAIRGTVTDVNPDHYWLVIENSDGNKVAGPGTVNDNTSFTDKKFFDWDTTKVSDGDYTIKLEARDQAGNKDPNEAPVKSDPNKDDDSVDWINVKVKNDPDVGDVVINEIMWMGSSGKSSDEWIELRNMTNHDINLKNWDIDGAVSGSGRHLEIIGGQDDIIPANGYFLIANYSKNNSAINVKPDFVSANISLKNKYKKNGKLVLKDKNGNIIDSTPNPSDSNWSAGSNGNVKESMERNDDPGDGIEISNWHTCLDDKANDDIYWDVTNNDDGKNYGTPGAANLSKNDPTSPDYDPNFKDSVKNKKKVEKKVTKKKYQLKKK